LSGGSRLVPLAVLTDDAAFARMSLERAAELRATRKALEFNLGRNYTLQRDPLTGGLDEAVNVHDRAITPLHPAVELSFRSAEYATGYFRWVPGGAHSEQLTASRALLYREQLGLTAGLGVARLEVVNVDLPKRISDPVTGFRGRCLVCRE